MNVYVFSSWLAKRRQVYSINSFTIYGFLQGIIRWERFLVAGEFSRKESCCIFIIAKYTFQKVVNIPEIKHEYNYAFVILGGKWDLLKQITDLFV